MSIDFAKKVVVKVDKFFLSFIPIFYFFDYINSFLRSFKIIALLGVCIANNRARTDTGICSCIFLTIFSYFLKDDNILKEKKN